LAGARAGHLVVGAAGLAKDVSGGVNMLVRAVVAAMFESNCWVLAPGRGQECVVVDPGIGVLTELDALLAAEDLRPAAVLLTHGHLDHCFSVAPVCGARGITAYVHPGDREMVADPAKGLSMGLQQLFGGRLTYTEPEDVAPLPEAGTITVAGLELMVDRAPGHTEGSVLFRLAGANADLSSLPRALAGSARTGGAVQEAERICLSGDVLFAGSIGRTDLPGGSMPAMLSSLRDKVLPLHDETVVLPGHGPVTTIERERRTNPYLLEVVDHLTRSPRLTGL
jgi:hydroxyacylglutathione hydrolase